MTGELPPPPSTPRIAPLPPAEWAPEMRDALAALRPPDAATPDPTPREGRSKALNLLGTFAHHPALSRAFLTFNGHVLSASTLTARARELLVLRVATVHECEYEWAQHVVLARDAGLDDDEIARVREGPGATGWSSVERAMLSAVDELRRDGMVSDGTWRVLAAQLDDQQLMDLLFTVGAYAILAAACRSVGVELDDDLRAPGPDGGPPRS